MHTHANTHTHLHTASTDAETDKYIQTHTIYSDLYLSPVYTYTQTITNIHTLKYNFKQNALRKQ